MCRTAACATLVHVCGVVGSLTLLLSVEKTKVIIKLHKPAVSLEVNKVLKVLEATSATFVLPVCFHFLCY